MYITEQTWTIKVWYCIYDNQTEVLSLKTYRLFSMLCNVVL
jgi:hypothetical protein